MMKSSRSISKRVVKLRMIMGRGFQMANKKI